VLNKAFAARGYYGVLGLLLELPEKAAEILGCNNKPARTTRRILPARR